MKALTWKGQRDVRVEDVQNPRIGQPTEAVIKITSSAICGSDLHLYEVLGPYIKAGDILAHEPMGLVEEVVPGASGISVGDRVDTAPEITCPTNVTDNETDHVSTGQGQLLYDHLQCQKEFHRFTLAEGADGHCQGIAPIVFWTTALNWLGDLLAKN